MVVICGLLVLVDFPGNEGRGLSGLAAIGRSATVLENNQTPKGAEGLRAGSPRSRVCLAVIQAF